MKMTACEIEVKVLIALPKRQSPQSTLDMDVPSIKTRYWPAPAESRYPDWYLALELSW